ncbi:MAG: hypothetical protein Kow00124_06640 [Anaerolineae bacterium]
MGITLAACGGPPGAGAQPEGPPESQQPPGDQAATQPAPLPTDTSPPAADTPIPTPTSALQQVAAPTIDAEQLAVLAALNEWRISQGLWPLKINETLQQMALDQARYVLLLPAIPAGGDIHLGPGGKQPAERALGYGWPYYNTAAQVAISEIAYVGASPDAALTFWRGSAIHNSAVTNPAFREAGVAVLPHSLGDLYLVVLGARPGMLPALYDPQSGLLYLSSERYRWAAGDRIQDVTGVQVLPSSTSTIDPAGWQPWSLTTSAPPSPAAPFAVALTDGTHQVITEVNPAVDIAWLPGNLGLAAGGVAAAPQDSAALTPAAPAPAQPPQAAQPTAIPPTSAPPVVTTGGDGSTDIAIIYDAISLTIVNTSDSAIDLTGLVLSGGSTSVPIELWATQWLTVPLYEFPAGDCLQIWRWDYDDPGQSPECRYRRSAIYIQPEKLFWTGPFELRRGDALLAACTSGPARCEADLR